MERESLSGFWDASCKWLCGKDIRMRACAGGETATVNPADDQYQLTCSPSSVEMSAEE